MTDRREIERRKKIMRELVYWVDKVDAMELEGYDRTNAAHRHIWQPINADYKN